MNTQTALPNNELLIALEQQKEEQCAIFCARLNKMASIIRKFDLSTSQAADLLDQESELIQAQNRGYCL